MTGIIYFECSSGISGDMAVASMIDLGIDQNRLLHTLNSVPVEGFEIKISRVDKSGINVCDFDVILEEDNHDHDMEYLYGEHHHEHHHHHHEHRGLSDVLKIISETDMTERARDIAMKIFTIIAEAEAEAHATSVDKVHFHEVGAIDSIVDVIALAHCIDELSPEHVCVSELYEGTGTVRCQHGIIPVPAPATLSIATRYGLPLRISESKGEYVTPTGAAFVAAVRDTEVPDTIIVKKVGMGNGKRKTDRPGYVRAMIIEPA
ncbi:MAG: LarC family nickel insertion protein [Candidatus Methanomethylophilaceae archaeon]|nr:LarC family nickel insertion protein [Candidatus Methanomethylophilaceae archaeon]